MNASFFASPTPEQRCRVGNTELHCGDCFQIEIDGRWRDVRIELARDGWHLVGLIGWADYYDGYPARFYP